MASTFEDKPLQVPALSEEELESLIKRPSSLKKNNRSNSNRSSRSNSINKVDD